MSVPLRLIVNADDLGMSREVNKATFAAIDAGLVTSTTILANGAGFDHAVKQVAKYPHVSFGVHLNATEYKPLTDDPRLSPLLNDKGEFARKFFSTPMDRELATALLKEWAAQLRKVRDAGVPITHIDSHHLVHSDWKVLHVVKELQRITGIRRIRPVKNLSLDMRTPKRRLGSLKRIAWRQAVLRGAPTRMVDGFAEFAIVWGLYERGQLPYRFVEAMVHPAHPDYAAETVLLEHLGPEIENVDRVNYWDV